MKKLIPIFILLLLSELSFGQTRITTLGTADFLMKSTTGAHRRASATVVRDGLNHSKSIEFKVTQTDSTNLTKTLVYTELSDTLTYTLVRDTGSVGIFKLTCTNGTPFTAGKTKVSFSQNQGTGKCYFSAANTSTSLITLYSYLQTSDAVTDAGFGSVGTYIKIDVFP